MSVRLAVPPLDSETVCYGDFYPILIVLIILVFFMIFSEESKFPPKLLPKNLKKVHETKTQKNYLFDRIAKKILHMGNIRPSCTCLIQEYRYYTKSLSLYNESLSIPYVQVYTMRLSLYQKSFSISCIQFYTMSPSIYHVS